MRNVTSARLGIAAVLGAMGALGAVAGGCVGDDNAAPPTSNDAGSPADSAPAPVVDSGVDATLPGNDAGDAGNTVDAAEAGIDSGFDGGTLSVDARLVFVHAAPGLGPVRICLATGTGGVIPIPALPHDPSSFPSTPPPPTGTGGAVAPGTVGFYPGTIGALHDVADLSTFAITPFLIDATQIANDTIDGGPDGGAEIDCVHLLGTHGLGASDAPVAGSLAASAFWKLPTIAAGTLADGNTYLLTITGCVGGYTPTPNFGITAQEICGPDFPGDGGANLAVGVATLDTTTPVDGGVGVQFAHRSTALEGAGAQFNGNEIVYTHPPASDGVVPGFVVVSADDAGGETSFVTIADQPVKAGGAQITPLRTVAIDPASTSIGALTFPGSQPDGGPIFARYPGSQNDGLADLVEVTLTGTADLSNWGKSTADGGPPATFTPGTAYTFILLGNNDPGVPPLVLPGDTSVNPAYDGRGLHFVAFPNVFAPRPLP